MSGSSLIRIPPWRSLTDEQCRSHAPGRAEIPASLAGRALALVEWVQGKGAVSNEAPGIPRNPQGLYGHDHSGPPYGTAIRHPMAVMGGNNGTAWTRRTGAGIQFQPFIVGGSTQRILSVRCPLWVRAFSPSEKAPYSRAYLRFRALNTSAGTITLTVRVRHPGGSTETGTVSVSTTSFVSYALAAPFLRLEPGEHVLDISFSSSSTSILTRLSGLSVGQTALRSH